MNNIYNRASTCDSSTLYFCSFTFLLLHALNYFYGFLGVCYFSLVLFASWEMARRFWYLLFFYSYTFS